MYLFAKGKVTAGDRIAADVPRIINRVRLMQEFGWTPAEVDSLSQEDMSQIIAVMNAEAKLRKLKKK